MNLQNVAPAMDPVFNTGCVPGCTVTTCSCTQSSGSSAHWSSTTVQESPALAWAVEFHDGNTGFLIKNNSTFVRAIRSGA